MDDISGGIIETAGYNRDGSVKYQAAPRPEAEEKKAEEGKRIKW
jgi:hypothetical protein